MPPDQVPCCPPPPSPSRLQRLKEVIEAQYEDFLRCDVSDDNATKLVMRLRIKQPEEDKVSGAVADETTLKKLDHVRPRCQTCFL